MFSDRKNSVVKLLAGWGLYWVGLAGITLGKPLMMMWRISRQSPHGDAGVSAGINNGMFEMSVTAQGATMWSGSMPVFLLALLIAGPPLVMWLLWLYARSRVDVRDDELLQMQSQRLANTAMFQTPKNSPVQSDRPRELEAPSMPLDADITVQQRDRVRSSDDNA